MTTKPDPLARVRAMVDALDVDRAGPLDSFGQIFDTPPHRVSTPKPAELLVFRHFGRFGHPAAGETVGSAPCITSSAIGDDVMHTSRVASSFSSGQTGQTGKKRKSINNINELTLDSRSTELSNGCPTVSKGSAPDEYPIVLVDDHGLPCAPCSWCGTGLLWRPRPPDRRWRCAECEPDDGDDAQDWFALPSDTCQPTDSAPPSGPCSNRPASCIKTSSGDDAADQAPTGPEVPDRTGAPPRPSESKAHGGSRVAKSGESRASRLFAEACRLFDLGHDEARVRDQLRELNNSTGWGDNLALPFARYGDDEVDWIVKTAATAPRQGRPDR